MSKGLPLGPAKLDNVKNDASTVRGPDKYVYQFDSERLRR